MCMQFAREMLTPTCHKLPLTPAYDMWMLGMLVYEVVTGEPYWRESLSDSEILNILANPNEQLPHQQRPLEGAVQKLVAQLMERNPAARISASDLHRQLHNNMQQLKGCMTVTAGDSNLIKRRVKRTAADAEPQAKPIAPLPIPEHAVGASDSHQKPHEEIPGSATLRPRVETVLAASPKALPSPRPLPSPNALPSPRPLPSPNALPSPKAESPPVPGSCPAGPGMWPETRSSLYQPTNSVDSRITAVSSIHSMCPCLIDVCSSTIVCRTRLMHRIAGCNKCPTLMHHMAGCTPRLHLLTMIADS
jgi:hypothetical protein